MPQIVSPFDPRRPARLMAAQVVGGELEKELNDADSGPWILERREGDTLHHVGTFGSFTEAMKALDERVGLGHGSLGDYELVEVRPPSFWTKFRARFNRKQ